jgi:hypothetical protein
MYYPNSALWIGSKSRGGTALGHSTYGTRVDDVHGIVDWINLGVLAKDWTFNQFFRQVTGIPIRKSTRQQREEFFAEIDYINFVQRSLGPVDRNPTREEYEQAIRDLPAAIELAKPEAIFAFGMKHHPYSLPVIAAMGIPCQPSVHVVWDTKKRFLPAWREFERMLRAGVTSSAWAT